MNPLVQRLTESVAAPDTRTPLPVIIEQRPVDNWKCPHCQQEIHEKHTYVHEGVDYHSDCKGPIKFPPTEIDPQWRKLLGGPA